MPGPDSTHASLLQTAEAKRVLAPDGASTTANRWRLWGPYVSNRQWGTVREDYSDGGHAWSYFSYDHARSRAYRWGEDGIFGICDCKQRLCFAIALWNNRPEEPGLKERFFGLTNEQGNHGEDVKEYYWYTDNVPSHSWMRAVYKYPHSVFPAPELTTKKAKNDDGAEFELLDTGIFSHNDYSDVTVEYAKNAPDDILIRITVENRSSDPRTLHVLPTLWFRNVWTWEANSEELRAARDISLVTEPPANCIAVTCKHPDSDIDNMTLYSNMDFAHQQARPEPLFAENSSDKDWSDGKTKFPKNAISDIVVGKRRDANQRGPGSKVAIHCVVQVPANGRSELQLRLVKGALSAPFEQFSETLERARAEADEFIESLAPNLADASTGTAGAGLEPERRKEQLHILKNAVAGMLWGKQYYEYDVERWVAGDGDNKPPDNRGRNKSWTNLKAADVLSVPDTWEFPWFALWDSCFHAIVYSMFDPDFAMNQLDILSGPRYTKSVDGCLQLPSYEWDFDDLNPPVLAWASWRIYQIERALRGRSGQPTEAGKAFLRTMFARGSSCLKWWMRTGDPNDDGLYDPESFLGLDNIHDLRDINRDKVDLAQADATGWTGLCALTLTKMALELADVFPDASTEYQKAAASHLATFVFVSASMNHKGGFWDEADGFYYDRVSLSGDPTSAEPVRVRSMVGLVPLFSVETIDLSVFGRLTTFRDEFLAHCKPHPEWLADLVVPDDARELIASARPESKGRILFALVPPGIKGGDTPTLDPNSHFARVLKRMLDPQEFLVTGRENADDSLRVLGIRSLSAAHQEHPGTIPGKFAWGSDVSVFYSPAEALEKEEEKGGNSNWRGPVWFPLNFLIIESLRKFAYYLGDKVRVDLPERSEGLNLSQVADVLSAGLISIFERCKDGHRVVFGGIHGSLAQFSDPHWRDYIFFHEYFHGKNGAGLGASHQTGWTGLVAKLIVQMAKYGQHVPTGAPVPVPRGTFRSDRPSGLQIGV